MIRASFSAVPRRWLVLASKCTLFGFVALVVAEAVSFVASLLGQQILSGTTPTASLSGPGALSAVFSGGLYLFALGLLALRLGFVIRHTAVAISTFVGLMFVLRVISDLLPSSLSADLGRFLPQNIGTVMFTVQYHGTDPQDW